MRYKKKENVLAILFVLLLFISVAYAYLNSNLSIAGIAGINNARWSVYFDNINIDDGSVDTISKAAVINDDKDEVSYNITLNVPGDYYEFTVDVVNDGSIDAMIESVTTKINGSSTNTLPEYIKYSTTYIDGIEIKNNHRLNAGNVETYLVRVEYDSNIDASQLPDDDVTLNMSFEVNYVQATDEAIDLNSANRLKLVSDYVKPSDSFLDGPITRENIEDIKFVSNNQVSSNAIGSFDVSEKNNGSIMAWYTDVDGDGLYEVKIGSSDGYVLTNTNSQFLFMNCINVTNIDFSNFSTRGTTNMGGMFSSLYINVNNGTTESYYMKLPTLDLSHFNTSEVVDMNDMFRGCTSLTTLDISSFDTRLVKDMSGMFATSYNTGTVYDMENNPDSSSSSGTLQFMKLEQIIGIENLHTDSVETIGFVSMFGGCNKLEELDLSKWKTSNVTNMSAMFSACTKLKKLYLGNWDTSKVTNMTAMFSGCINLEDLNISSFNTSKLTTMTLMFSGCRKLTNLDLSHFDFSKVTNMSNAFGQLNRSTINVSGSSFRSTVNINNLVKSSTAVTLIVKTEADKTLFDNKNFSNLTVEVK